MAEERNVGLARATDSTADADSTDSTKAELQRRMEEARESITQTVTEIKDTVVTQYQQVKDNISDTLDWREQYRRHTVPFTVGAFAVGALAGYTVMGAFKGEGEDDYDGEDDAAFDRIEKGFDRGVGAKRSYAAQPVLGGRGAPAAAYQRSSRPESNASTESAEVFGRGEEQDEDVGPETRPSYSSGYQAPTAPPTMQGLAAYAASGPADADESEEPKGPGLIGRFKETKAYDRLQEEISTLGERALEELSRTAQTVVVPALLSKLKDMIGIDLSTQKAVAQRSRIEQQTAQTTARTAAAVEDVGSGQDKPGTNARAASGGTEGYGAS